MIKQTVYGDREKCYKCFRPKSSCMCSYATKIDTNTKFIILMHPKEFKKVKNNTGFLTHISLPNSKVYIGIDFTNHKEINEIINTHKSYILYPSKDAINLSTQNLHVKDTNLALFLIDSTWACAKSIFKASLNLQKLPHLSFSVDRKSNYEIKAQPEENFLSTMETVQVVLELLDKQDIEGIEKQKLDNFLNPFFEMIKYQKELISNPKSNAVRFRKKT